MSSGTDLAGRDPSEEDIVLSVLDAIERDPSITQRSVAREVGIALGLANAYLKRCVHRGLIKVSQVPRRRYAYYLTPQGFAEKSRLTASYLAHSFSFFRRAREQCGELFAKASAARQRRIVLLGASELAEIASLVAREHPIEIVGMIAAPASGELLAGALQPLGRVDAIIVTALERSKDVYGMALDLLGPERVYAPALLRLHAPGAGTEPEEAA
jgi:DNA-binding MarR family transcriptional regulator